MRRLVTMSYFFQNSVQFLKLDKVEIGGLQGKDLAYKVIKIHKDFKQIYGLFSIKNYDSLDPEDRGFEEDCLIFNSEIEELDRKLGAILVKAFDDCTVSESLFKLLKIFEDFLLRKPIVCKLEEKLPNLLQMLNEEIDDQKQKFLEQEERIQYTGRGITERNMPPVSGELKISQEFKQKITKTLDSFAGMVHPIKESEQGCLIMNKYKELVGQIISHEKTIYHKWAENINVQIEEILNCPLIVRSTKNQTICVNFREETLTILMEVKNFKKDFPERKIPERASDVFKRFEELRTYNNLLEQTADLYNYLRIKTIRQEFKLIEYEIIEIDSDLQPAENTLTWNSRNILDYIKGLRNKVFKLNERMKIAQTNFSNVKYMINQWATIPLFTRKSAHENDNYFVDISDMQKLKDNIFSLQF